MPCVKYSFDNLFHKSLFQNKFIKSVVKISKPPATPAVWPAGALFSIKLFLVIFKCLSTPERNLCNLLDDSVEIKLQTELKDPRLPGRRSLLWSGSH